MNFRQKNHHETLIAIYISLASTGFGGVDNQIEAEIEGWHLEITTFGDNNNEFSTRILFKGVPTDRFIQE